MQIIMKRELFSIQHECMGELIKTHLRYKVKMKCVDSSTAYLMRS